MKGRQAKKGRLRLRLYVSGNSPNSLRAIVNTRAICERHFESAHELEIVDLARDAKLALKDGIIVTPTLIKLSPPPIQRMIGNLSDTGAVLLVLGRR